MSKIVGSKHCSKCGKAICITYYPFDRTVDNELVRLEKEHQINLCNTCIFAFATCDALEVEFGKCVGNDNVISCLTYKRKHKNDTRTRDM